MAVKKKFSALYEFYLETDSNKDRKERYTLAEAQYKDAHGEYVYNDFRMFQAALSLNMEEGTPHQSNNASYVRKR